AAAVACRNCHQIGTQGKHLGPDLSKIAEKLSREQILESILEPSKRIDPKYVSHVVETADGLIVSGLLENETADRIVLRDAQDKLHDFDKSDVEDFSPQSQSLMPELLVRDLTAQQLADLLEYLSSLK
ncbi:MAG: c-type cytochrome, partial [Planctomycetales bacterium]|nr:c-type cytochrome [Planctomycetales bacterium]